MTSVRGRYFAFDVMLGPYCNRDLFSSWSERGRRG